MRASAWASDRKADQMTMWPVLLWSLGSEVGQLAPVSRLPVGLENIFVQQQICHHQARESPGASRSAATARQQNYCQHSADEPRPAELLPPHVIFIGFCQELKGTVSRDFLLSSLHQSIPYGPLIHHLKSSRFWFQMQQIFWIWSLTRPTAARWKKFKVQQISITVSIHGCFIACLFF